MDTSGIKYVKIRKPIEMYEVRSRCTTHLQFLKMVQYMEKYGDLSRIGNYSRLHHVKKWAKLTKYLNNLPNATVRCEGKWKKVWSDLKNNTKKKLRKQRQNGLPITLNNLEKRTLRIMQRSREATGNQDQPSDSDSGEAENTNEKVLLASTHSPLEDPLKSQQATLDTQKYTVDTQEYTECTQEYTVDTQDYTVDAEQFTVDIEEDSKASILERTQDNTKTNRGVPSSEPPPSIHTTRVYVKDTGKIPKTLKRVHLDDKVKAVLEMKRKKMLEIPNKPYNYLENQRNDTGLEKDKNMPEEDANKAKNNKEKDVMSEKYYEYLLEREAMKLKQEKLRMKEFELRERTRQRDMELQLQGQWLSFMKETMGVLLRLIDKSR